MGGYLRRKCDQERVCQRCVKVSVICLWVCQVKVCQVKVCQQKACSVFFAA